MPLQLSHTSVYAIFFTKRKTVQCVLVFQYIFGACLNYIGQRWWCEVKHYIWCISSAVRDTDWVQLYTSMCGVHAREKFFYLVHQPSAILFLLSLCTPVTGKPAAAGRSFVLTCHRYFARSTLPGTGWQHEERDPVPELTLGRPRLYLQLRGGHPLDSELSHAVLPGPMPNSSLLCPQSLHFLSSRRQPETGKRHRHLVWDLHGGVAFPMAREAKAPAAQNVHWDRE
jgi:hypothetical protein